MTTMMTLMALMMAFRQKLHEYVLTSAENNNNNTYYRPRTRKITTATTSMYMLLHIKK